MDANRRNLALLSGLLSGLLVGGACAAQPSMPWPEGVDPSAYPPPSRGALQLLGGDLPDGNYGSVGVRADGALQHLAGRHFASSDGWWVLVCQYDDCRLEPASLQVREAAHPTYDGPEVPGQRLSLQLLPEAEGLLRRSGGDPGFGGRPRQVDDSVILAAFRPAESLAALPLSRDSVPTWWYSHPRVGVPTTPTPFGHNLPPAAERQVLVGEAGTLTLRQLPPVQQGVSERPLEIELGGVRQPLGTHYVHMDDGQRPVELGEVLQWVGDLDGDGRPDLLVNHSGYFWDLALYLSSLAQPGELVGEAGRFTWSRPDSPGC